MEEIKEPQLCIRCIRCNKLLGKVPIDTVANINLKCPRCRTDYVYKLGENGNA